ncbi:bestrophin family ion channel [Mangrovibacter phragmitis]|uniref:bestrophin family protein n=1 Tax=Mangrovibacter phragmitis TaxID=1691903 RepID=UPI00336A7E50
MIVRPAQHWFTRLFAWHGSVMSKIYSRLLLNLLLSLILLGVYSWYESLHVKITLAPFSLLGIAIAIFLGFRNSASWARYCEARQLWGSLLINCRSLMREVITLFPNDAHYQQSLKNDLLAFCYCLNYQLRHKPVAAVLQRFIELPVATFVNTQQTPCNRLLLIMGEKVAEARRSGRISDILYQNLNAHLNQLSGILGGCERIANTPVPFAYSLILHRTVYAFCTLLPFALINQIHVFTPMVSVFISYTFISLDTLAEELEEPFGTEANDLALDAICNTIEIELCQMAGDSHCPAKMYPDKQHRLT